MKSNLNLCPCGCGQPRRTVTITRVCKYAQDKCRYNVAKKKALERQIEKERIGA